MKKRKICIVTGSRAEYGLLYPLIKKVKEEDSLRLQLIVTGAHLSKEFGWTYKEIEQDFIIDEKIDIVSTTDSIGIAESMAKAQVGFVKTFKRLKPDIVVLLGDRYEIFTVASCAVLLNIPIAHIHGGESTYGANDELFRHAITKMSYLHFTATKAYQKRVIQLGENPKRVFNVGSLGIENIKNITLISAKEIEDKFNFKFLDKNILITYHPETLSNISVKKQFNALVKALDQFKDIRLIFTKANADVGGNIINEMIDNYIIKNKNAICFTSMGQINYFSTLKIVDMVIGNSSSGIIEVPSFGIATINIGNRQGGRISASSVIHCAINQKEIYHSILNSYKNKEKLLCREVLNPYEKNGTSDSIISVLKSYNLKKMTNKIFYDL